MQAKETQHSGMYRITGYGDFVVANRISYEFGLKGPSYVLDPCYESVHDFLTFS